MGLTKGKKYPQIGVTNKLKYGEDRYVKIGAIGGKISNPDRPKGFAFMKANGQTDKIKEAGRLGGKNSRRARASDYL